MVVIMFGSCQGHFETIPKMFSNGRSGHFLQNETVNKINEIVDSLVNNNNHSTK